MNWPKSTSVLKSPEYNTMVLDAIRAGNFEAKWAKIVSFANGHQGEFRVFGDALKIDGVRINVSATLQQQIADLLSCSLLTPRLEDLRWYQRTATLPMFYAGDNVINGGTMDTSFEMIRHSERVEGALKEALARGESDALICTVGKIWALDNVLASQPHKACNYGWIAANGPHACVTPSPLPAPNPHTSAAPCRLFQQPGTFHDPLHSDYSQTCVLVSRECVIDGAPSDIFKVMTSAELAPLVSHQGKLLVTRQPGVAEFSPLYAPEVRTASQPPFRRVSLGPLRSGGLDASVDGPDWGVVAVAGGAIALTVAAFWYGMKKMGHAAGSRENPATLSHCPKNGSHWTFNGFKYWSLRTADAEIVASITDRYTPYHPPKHAKYEVYTIENGLAKFRGYLHGERRDRAYLCFQNAFFSSPGGQRIEENPHAPDAALMRRWTAIEGWKITYYEPRYGMREFKVYSHKELAQAKADLDADGNSYRITEIPKGAR